MNTFLTCCKETIKATGLPSGKDVCVGAGEGGGGRGDTSQMYSTHLVHVVPNAQGWSGALVLIKSKLTRPPISHDRIEEINPG